MDAQLRKLLDEYKPYLSVDDGGKIKCNINGHCLPAKYDAVLSFVKGSKFQKLKKRKDAEDNLEKFEPFIVKSKNFPTMLYCALTGQLIDQAIDAVKRHIQGKKFKKEQIKFQSDQQELKPEPDLKSFGVTADHREQADGDGEGAEEEEEEEEIFDPSTVAASDLDTDMEEVGGVDGGDSGSEGHGVEEAVGVSSSGDAEMDVEAEVEEGVQIKHKSKQRKAGAASNGKENGNGAELASRKKKNVARPAAAKKRKV